MGSSSALIDEFKVGMMEKFEMIGLLNYSLSHEVLQNEGGIFISQMKYITDLLKRFNMLNCKGAATPMNLNEKLQVQDGTDMANAKAFRSLVGGLIYLTHTRPDIIFLVGVVSRFLRNSYLLKRKS